MNKYLILSGKDAIYWSIWCVVIQTRTLDLRLHGYIVLYGILADNITCQGDILLLIYSHNYFALLRVNQIIGFELRVIYTIVGIRTVKLVLTITKQAELAIVHKGTCYLVHIKCIHSKHHRS